MCEGVEPANADRPVTVIVSGTAFHWITPMHPAYLTVAAIDHLGQPVTYVNAGLSPQPVYFRASSSLVRHSAPSAWQVP